MQSTNDNCAEVSQQKKQGVDYMTGGLWPVEDLQNVEGHAHQATAFPRSGQ